MLNSALALVLAASTAGQGSLACLADQVVEQLVGVYGTSERRVVGVEADRIVVAPGSLARGIELEILAEAQPFRDPDTLERLGVLLEPVATARVVASNKRMSLATLERVQQLPQVNDPVRLAPRTVVVGLRSVKGDERLEPALQALCDVLPYRLERSGLFLVRHGPPLTTPVLGRQDLEAFRRAADGDGLDATLALGLHLDQGELTLMMEIVGTPADAPVALHTVRAELDAQALRYMVSASTPAGSTAPRIRPLARIEGEVLALGRAQLGEDPEPALLALSTRGLWTLREGTPPRLLVDLAGLPMAPVATRRPAGTLVVVQRSPAAPAIAFGTNRLATGHVYANGALKALEAMPLAVLGGYLVQGNYLPGQNLFDGSLMGPDGWRDIGPFMDLRADNRSLYVRRDDLSLERFTPDLESTEPLERHSGDAWDTDGGAWLTTATSVVNGKDQLKWTTPDGSVRQSAFTAPLTAAELLDPISEEVAVAEAPLGGASLVSVFRWP